YSFSVDALSPTSLLFPYTTLFRSEAAVSSARINNTTVEKVLLEDYNVPKEELGKSLAAFYSSNFFSYDGAQTIPPDLKDRVPSRSEEHTSELQSLTNLACRLLLDK